MIEVDPIRFKLKPYAHQLRGVRTLLRKPVYGLYWKPRLGKTKAVIDTACLLFEAGEIDTVLVVAPAQVKDVWLEKNLGEIVTHDWSGAPVYEYKAIDSVFLPHGCCCYIVASVELLRQQGPRNNFPFVDNLLATLSGRRVWFVFDEGSALGTWNSLQSRSMIELRKGDPIRRMTMLDGTPGGNSRLVFYSKFKVLDPAILGCKTFYQYRARYFETVKVPHKWVKDESGERKVVATHMEVTKEKNWDDFITRTTPYCEFLEQDALDMPKFVPSILTAAMGAKEWAIYCQMRDETVAELDSGVCAAGQAAVKCIRLAQICAGFLGGVQEFTQGQLDGSWAGPVSANPITKEIHSVTADLIMNWLKARFIERPDFKVVIWAWFVPEILRLIDLVVEAGHVVGVQYGAEKSNMDMLHPRHPYQGEFVGIAQPQAAQYGLNFSKADTNVFLSQDYNRVTRTQAEQRTEAPGRLSTSMIDVLVTGPRGQRTIVHDIVQSIREKEELERRTTDHWKRVLLEE